VLEQGASSTDGGGSSGAAVVIGSGGDRRGARDLAAARVFGSGGGGGGIHAARENVCGAPLVSWFFAGHPPSSRVGIEVNFDTLEHRCLRCSMQGGDRGWRVGGGARSKEYSVIVHSTRRMYI
jgi:hypothetical protein